MEHELLSEYIAPVSDAKVVVLFGGNPNRRDEIIRLLMTLKTVSVYGTLSEEEGIEKISALKKLDLVLIGGRYSEEQRVRIRSLVKSKLPNTKISEPGYDYPYENNAILKDINHKLQLPN